MSNVVPQRISHLVCAAVLALWLWNMALPVAAALPEPPVIVHTPITQAYADTPLIIRAQVHETALVDQVRLYFRQSGAAEFYSMNMVPMHGEYRTVIPAEYMATGVLEYYIQAQDITGNSSFYPGNSYRPTPLKVDVTPDDTPPQIELLQPRQWTPREGYTLFILLYDAAGNIDPSTIRLYYNDKDVTARASITAAAIMYRVPAAESTFQTRVRVTAADIAGNLADQTFYLIRSVDWSGELRLETRNGDWTGSYFAFTSVWGPLDLRLKLQPPTMEGRNIVEYTLTYDARLMHLAFGDVVSQVAPVAIGAIKQRGLDLTLRLGPISLQTVYGYAQENPEYLRQIAAVKPALDTCFLDLALTAVKIKDYPRDAVTPESNPQLNYVIAASGGLAAFNSAIGVQAEVSVSLYHDNARGDLWSVLDEIDPREVAEGDDALADILVTLINYLKTIPTEVRAYWELPDVRYGFPQVDVGGRVNAWLPLPWSQLQASAYYYGRSYRTINTAAPRNKEGITAEFRTQRLFNFLQLYARYEQQLDNVASLLDLLTKNKLSNRTETSIYAAGVSLGPSGGTNLNVGMEHAEAGAFGAAVERITQTYDLELTNAAFSVNNRRFTWDAAVKLQDIQVLPNPLADKQVVSYQLRGRMEHGVLSYTLSYGHQFEKSAFGQVRWADPSLAGSIRLQLDDIAFFGTWPRSFMLQLSAGRNLPVTAADDPTEQRYYAKVSVDAELRLFDNLRLSAGWQHGFNPGAAPQNIWQAGLRWRF